MKYPKIHMTLTAALGVFLAAPAMAVDTYAEDWDYEPLYDDWRISQVMDGTVHAAGGKKVGEVHDILFGPEGLVDTIVVEKKVNDELNWQYYEVAWANVDFDPALGQVQLDMSSKEIANREKRDVPAFAESSEVEASNLLGMTVNLENQDQYGEIADLLISEGENELSAFVVQSDGIGDMQYAVPAGFETIDVDPAMVELPYDDRLIEDLDRFATSDS